MTPVLNSGAIGNNWSTSLEHAPAEKDQRTATGFTAMLALRESCFLVGSCGSQHPAVHEKSGQHPPRVWPSALRFPIHSRTAMVLCELEGQRQRQLAEWLGTMRCLFVCSRASGQSSQQTWCCGGGCGKEACVNPGGQRSEGTDSAHEAG